MLCCLFYCHLAFQRDPKSFKRVIAFFFFFSKKEWRLHTGFWTDSRSKRKKNTRGKPAAPISPQNYSTGLSATFQLNSKPNSSPQHTLQSSAESKKASHPGGEIMLLGPTVDTSRVLADCRANTEIDPDQGKGAYSSRQAYREIFQCPGGRRSIVVQL